MGRAGPVVRVRGTGKRSRREREMEGQEERKQREPVRHSPLQRVV